MFSRESAADWGKQRALNTWETSNTLRTKQPAGRCAAHRIFNNHWHFSTFSCWTPWQDYLGTDSILASSTVVSAGQELVLWLLTFYLPWIPNTKLTGQWQLIKLGSLILGFKVMPSTWISQYFKHANVNKHCWSLFKLPILAEIEEMVLVTEKKSLQQAM